MIPFQIDPNWYQRYWLEEHPRRAPLLQALIQIDPNWYQRYWVEEHPRRAPLLRARIGMAAKRILRMFRPMRNGGSASVDAADDGVVNPTQPAAPQSI